MIELQETREQVANAQNQISVGAHETIRYEQRKNQAELEVIDLKNTMKGLKADRSSLENDNLALRKDLETERQINVTNTSELSKLKALLATFESTKGDLLVRLQNVSKEKQSEEKDRQQMLDEIKHLKQLILKKDQEIEDQRRSIIDLDQRYDSLCNQLDVKTEELN